MIAVMDARGAVATRSSRFDSAGKVAASMQIAGGLLVVTGAWLPWLTMFAGLQVMRGTVGLNGRVILLTGAMTALLGATSLRHHTSRLVRRIASLLAALTAGGASILLLRLIDTQRDLATHDAMMLARVGPGLFVVLLGAIMAAASLIPGETQ